MNLLLRVGVALGAVMMAGPTGLMPQAVTEPAPQALEYAIFGAIMAAILGGFQLAGKLIDFIDRRRNGPRGHSRADTAELAIIANCLKRVEHILDGLEKAMNSNASILAVIEERQRNAHSSMKKIAEGIEEVRRQTAA
jgi:hypothetical protein